MQPNYKNKITDHQRQTKGSFWKILFPSLPSNIISNHMLDNWIINYIRSRSQLRLCSREDQFLHWRRPSDLPIQGHSCCQLRGHRSNPSSLQKHDNQTKQNYECYLMCDRIKKERDWERKRKEKEEGENREDLERETVNLFNSTV